MVMKLVFVLPDAISRQHPQGREMRSRLLTGLLILSFITLPGPSGAEKMNEAFEVMPGCRALLAQLAESRLGQGYCLGYVAALVDFPLGICAPGTATYGQAVRVVTSYVDARPDRQHEPFAGLAMEALRQAWPCPLERRPAQSALPE